MKVIPYKRETFQKELIQILNLMFEQTKKVSYKYHYLLGYF